MHAPDVQGPMSSRTADLIVAEKPDVLMVGGPPFYLSGYKVDEIQLRNGLVNLTQIAQTVPVTLLEHHALRDREWRERTQSLFTAAAIANHKVMTAAEYLGKENSFLEFNRKQLWEESPPSAEFLKWTREGEMRISHIKPPP